MSASAHRVASRYLQAGSGYNPRQVYHAVRRHLSPDLLQPKYRRMHEEGTCDARTGHCFAASEAFYWLMGGPGSGYKPVSVQHEGGSHWWVRGPDGKVWDLTSEQFDTPVPYAQGRARGFGVGGKARPGAHPSRRGAELMRRVMNDLEQRKKKRNRTAKKRVSIDAIVEFKHEGETVRVKVKKSEWKGGQDMLYTWETTNGKKTFTTKGVPKPYKVIADVPRGHRT